MASFQEAIACRSSDSSYNSTELASYPDPAHPSFSIFQRATLKSWDAVPAWERIIVDCQQNFKSGMHIYTRE